MNNDDSILRVELAERSYEIVFGALADSLARLHTLSAGRRLLAVTDSRVGALYPEVLNALTAGDAAASWVLPAGEAHKTPEHAIALCRSAAAGRFDRHTLFVALGGGVTGDLTGFGAAIYMRGVEFVQIPTTLLAMVDSSVGGKTGVDIPEGKNLIGAFHQPILVLADPAFLKTLPRRELVSGLAEVVKYAMIFDEGFLSFLEERTAELLKPDLACYRQVIRRCCAYKAEVVRQDEREQGCRALLNYGHTFGHALEKLSNFALTHGEGIAIGMCIAAELAVATGRLRPGEAARQKALLEVLGLPTSVPMEFSAEAIFEAMTHDKKNANGRVHFVLPTACGRAEVAKDCPREQVCQVIGACR